MNGKGKGWTHGILLAGLLLSASAFALTPVVNWQGLKTMGLSGAGETIGIASSGTYGLDAAESAGLVPSTVTLTNPPGHAADAAQAGGFGSHAVYTAIVLHMIAPGAKIVICNTGAISCVSTLISSYGASEVVDNQDSGNTGDTTTYTPGQPVSATIDQQAYENQNNLIFWADTDSYGYGFFQDPWVAKSVTLNGTSYEAEDFGTASGGTSNAVETVATPPTTNWPLILQWADQNPNDGASFEAMVYNANGSLIATSNSSASGACSEMATGNSDLQCASIPGNAATPLKVYVVSTGGTPTAQTTIQLSFGNGGGQINSFGLSILTPAGSVSPFMADAGANSIIVAGATSASTIYPGSGVGPMLGLNLTADSFQTFQYPNVTGDWCLTLPSGVTSIGLGSEFCGNSNSSPELGGAAALMLQAGLSWQDVQQGMESTAYNPKLGGNAYSGAWGMGYVRPVKAFEQFITPPSPAIAGGSSHPVNTGSAITLDGSCLVPSGASVVAWKWNLGNGQTATTQNATATYNTSGTYTVTLNCEDKDSHGTDLWAPQTASTVVAASASGSTSGGAGGSGSGGGGSFGPVGIGGLLGLLVFTLWMRRRRMAAERD